MVEVPRPEPGPGRGARAQHLVLGRPGHAAADAPDGPGRLLRRRSRSTRRWAAWPSARWSTRAPMASRRATSSCTPTAGAITRSSPPAAGLGGIGTLRARRHRRRAAAGLPRRRSAARAHRLRRPARGRGAARGRRRLGLGRGRRGRRAGGADRQAQRPPRDRQRRLGREGRAAARRLGLDAAFNYRAGPVAESLRAAAPDGIDVYFDNVGGEHLEAALGALRRWGRVAICGAISEYEQSAPPPGVRNLFQAVGQRPDAARLPRLQLRRPAAAIRARGRRLAARGAHPLSPDRGRGARARARGDRPACSTADDRQGARAHRLSALPGRLAPGARIGSWFRP